MLKAITKGYRTLNGISVMLDVAENSGFDTMKPGHGAQTNVLNKPNRCADST